MSPASLARAAGPAAVLLGLLLAASLALRTGALRSGYWIDEAISVGIASRPLDEIPGTLLLDGSPPGYAFLLHGWMELVGDGEAATRSLSLLVALLAVPLAFLCARRLFGRLAGLLAATAVALTPFVSVLAQEARGYTLVLLCSLCASAAFGLAYVRGELRWRWAFGMALVALLYLHVWSAFLVAGFGAAWLWAWRTGRAGARSCDVFAVVGVLFLPWVPSLLAQASRTGAPWSARPGLDRLLDAPVALLGLAAVPLLLLGGWGAVRAARSGEDDLPAVLLGVSCCGLLCAWTASQVQPAWTDRYLTVLLGPLVLGLAGALVLVDRRRVVLVLSAVAALAWALTPVPSVKSNVRTVAQAVRADVRAGDVVVCTQPEQVPVLHRYLPSGLRWITLTGPVADPRVTDWRDGVERVRASSVDRDLLPVMDDLAPGQRLVLVTPIPSRPLSPAPWMRAVRYRSRLWRQAVQRDPTLRHVVTVPGGTSHRPSAVRISVFEKRAPAVSLATTR